MATALACGRSSRSSSSRFTAISAAITLCHASQISTWPAKAGDETASTGSAPLVKTMGIVAVASLRPAPRSVPPARSRRPDDAPDRRPFPAADRSGPPPTVLDRRRSGPRLKPALLKALAKRRYEMGVVCQPMLVQEANHRHRRLLRTRRKRPRGRRTAEKRDELAPSHCRPRGSRQASYRRNIALEGDGRCPLWVKSRHVQRKKSCPLYPRKRTCAVQLGDVRFVPIADIVSQPVLACIIRWAAHRPVQWSTAPPSSAQSLKAPRL